MRQNVVTRFSRWGIAKRAERFMLSPDVVFLEMASAPASESTPIRVWPAKHQQVSGQSENRTSGAARC
jgi:hypothetical protein